MICYHITLIATEPCHDDPCQSRGTRNVCTAKEPGVVPPELEGHDPTFDIEKDPIFAALLASNYTCECGHGFLPALNKTSCNRCDDGCSRGDPCASAAEPLNVCVADPSNIDSQGCGGYSCKCDGPNWIESIDGRSCQSCYDPCSLDPCATSKDIRNICVLSSSGSDRGNEGSSNCDTYRCSCGGVGFITGFLAQTCDPCPNPCLQSDPCQTSVSDANQCTMTLSNEVGHCGTVQCTCGPGYYLMKGSDGHQYCEMCDDPCDLEHDPCKVRESALNECRAVQRSSLRGAALLAGENDVCGHYECTCLGKGWIKGPGLQTCEECPDPCRNDPCSSSEDYRNQCMPTPIPEGDDVKQRCPHYKCVCSAHGWLDTEDRKSCRRCTSPCDSDPCNSAADPRNVCTPLPPTGGEDHLNGRCGSYQCTCGGKMFFHPPDRLSCQTCPNPCLSDPCKNQENSLNTCIPDLVSRRSFSQSQSVLEESFPPPAKLAGDRLLALGAAGAPVLLGISSTYKDPEPESFESQCPGYTCRCLGSGWKVAVVPQYSKSTCIPCADPCAGDPCRSHENPNNRCIPTSSGINYLCMRTNKSR